MSISQYITALPSLVLFCLVTLACIASAKIGSWFASNRTQKGIKEPEASVGTAVGAIMGLLAFMLGFTFSITASRFADRKELVIKQANAIATCYVRTSMIPEKQKLAIRKLLKEYVAVLIKTNIPDQDKADDYIARNNKIHLEIWRQTATLTKEDMDSEIRTFFSSSVNDVMAVARERKTVALIFKIPGILWSALLFLTVVSMFAIGYQAGVHGKRNIFDFPIITIAIAFALVVMLIADMDSTGKHRLRVSLHPLEDVQHLMEEDIP